MHPNPLVVLGIPRSALIIEAASGNQERILALAKAVYKTLAKQYHDGPSSNDELMTAFNAAIKELEDPDALKFYISELVDADDIQTLRQQRQVQKLAARDVEALTRLSQGFAFVDQFQALDITAPTSYFAELQNQRIILDVLSPFKGRARVTDVEDIAENAGTYNSKVKYEEGSWLEFYLKTNYKEHWYQYSRYVSDESVRLVGFIPQPTERQKDQGLESTNRVMLEGSVNQFRLSWLQPKDCWFLSQLRFGFADDMPAHASCVLYRRGRFAITDGLLGSALI